MGVPIRASQLRIVLWSCAFFYAGSFAAILSILHILPISDWSGFWDGGLTVGTPALLDARAHFAFQAAHGLGAAIWPYPPAFAYAFVPFAHLSLVAGYAANVVVMLALGCLAGVLLADAFEMPRWFGLVAALAWAPLKIAALSGQNTPLALLLIAVAIVAAKRGAPLVLGLAVGGLLYKPSIALPFVVLLLLRREWRAAGIGAICAGAWYLLSVAATAGDWAWLPAYAHNIQHYFARDFAHDAPNAVSLPGTLMRAGVPVPLAFVAGVALFVAAVPRLLRVDLLSALAITSLLAVATSAHAWEYEPAIALPALFYLMRAVEEPARTWLVVGAYVVALASMFSIPGVTWNLQAIVVLGLTAVLLSHRPTLRGLRLSAV